MDESTQHDAAPVEEASAARGVDEQASQRMHTMVAFRLSPGEARRMQAAND